MKGEISVDYVKWYLNIIIVIIQKSMQLNVEYKIVLYQEIGKYRQVFKYCDCFCFNYGFFYFFLD